MLMEPEISDLQLTVDTIKASLRDAQQTVAELRAEAEARRQEMVETQIARAQLEGRIREAEHRLMDARHVIDLQREELASSRSEREQSGRVRAALQSQLKRLQKQVSKINQQMGDIVSPVAMGSPRGEFAESAMKDSQQYALSATSEGESRVISEPDAQLSGTSLVSEVPTVDQMSMVAFRFHVVVKSGDTLWSLARRNHTSVSRLMVLNALLNDRIQIGQTLWLPEPSSDVLEQGAL